MNWRFGSIGHRFKASMSNGILTKNVPGWRKADKSDMTNLDKARIPRYAAMNLFLKVIAYILRRKSRQPGGEGQR